MTAPAKSRSATITLNGSSKSSPKSSIQPNKQSDVTFKKFGESAATDMNATASLQSSSTASYLINQSLNDPLQSELHNLPHALTRLRNWLLHHVNAGDPIVMHFQSMCGIKLLESNIQQSIIDPVTKQLIKPQSVDDSIHRSTTQRYRITNHVLHTYFTISAAMGNELFYIVFLPLLHWLVDAALLRRVILMWLVTYYVGQFMKDLMQLPRPLSPLIAKLETHYETEYGFPSTHAMISLTMPAAALALMHEQNQSLHSSNPWNMQLGLVIAFMWTASISCSRLYNGVHSLVDLIGGFLFGICVLIPVVYLSASFDAWLLRAAPHSITYVVLFSWMLVALYPKPQKWTCCFGDTTIIIGVATGVFTAVLNSSSTRQWQSLAATSDMLTLEFWPIALARVVVGTCVLFAVRAFFKATSLFVLPRLLLPDYDSTSKMQIRPDRIYLTEIPYRWITYAAIGFATIDSIPRLFDQIGI